MRNVLPFLLVLFSTALTGCSSLSDATIPAQESSVTSVEPDTIRLQDIPPVEFTGEMTQAEAVTVYDDTTVGPTSDVEGVEVDHKAQTVTIRSRSGDSTLAQVFKMPAYGETLQLRSDSVGFDGRVAGAPDQENVEVVTSSIDKPWHQDLMSWLWTVLALAVGGGLVLLFILRGLP